MVDAPRFMPAHCRAGRALLGLTQAELAEASEVGRMTVKRFEGGEAVRPAQSSAMRLALERAGVIFLPEGFEIDGRRAYVGLALSEKPEARDNG